MSIPFQGGRLFCCQGTYRNSCTLTAYAASANGAKLSFAFTKLTNNAVIRQFSTHLFQPVDPISPPSKRDFTIT